MPKKLPVVGLDPAEMAAILLRELGKPCHKENDPGLTAEEFAKEWGVESGTARRWLRQLRKEGKVVEGWRTYYDEENQRIQHTRVYRPKEENLGQKGGE